MILQNQRLIILDKITETVKFSCSFERIRIVMKKLLKNIAGTITVIGLFFIPFLSYVQDIKESEDNVDPEYIKSTITYIANQNSEKTVIRDLEEHAMLSIVKVDLEIKNALINKGYNSPQPIISRPYHEDEDED